MDYIKNLFTELPQAYLPDVIGFSLFKEESAVESCLINSGNSKTKKSVNSRVTSSDPCADDDDRIVNYDDSFQWPDWGEGDGDDIDQGDDGDGDDGGGGGGGGGGATSSDMYSDSDDSDSDDSHHGHGGRGFGDFWIDVGNWFNYNFHTRGPSQVLGCGDF